MPAPVVVTVPDAPVVSGDHNALMAAAGIDPSDYGYAEFIISHEGHWDPCVVNGGAHDCSYAVNGGQRAYGIGQALPGSKMAAYGADWATNVVTQLKWFVAYIHGSHGGTFASNYAFWVANNWY